VQTFLPYDSFEESAACLDYRRLGKQRVECKQILNALESGGGWSNHPATLMWRGYEEGLRQYQRVVIKEWIARGYTNNMHIPPSRPFDYPPWFGLPTFHNSHKSNLLRKDPEHYGQFGWTVPDDLPYVWPTP
jgi:hypothetical protein